MPERGILPEQPSRSTVSSGGYDYVEAGGMDLSATVSNGGEQYVAGLRCARGRI